jgi:cytochrome c oxidase cbb3-type subunit 2
MNFHTSHRAVVGFAFFGYLALTLLIAIVPAVSVQDTRGLPGVAARSALAEHGRAVYLREGCGYCHTQFVRDLPLDRPYGRATVAGDYANEDPPLPGTERTGPDLSNVAARQPSDTWHLLHLYNPRAVVPQSVMPGFPWYFEEKAAAAPGDLVVPVPPRFVSAQGHVIVARPEARALVAYLLSLRQPELQR